MLQKFIVTISILLSLGLIYIAFSIESPTSAPTSNQAVVIENGTQYINVFARAGYSPRVIKAKANMPTVLKMETKGTYDCSTAFVIPDLNYQQFLPATGITRIDIPIEKTVGSLTGTCSMGMYYFTVEFEA